jgi:F-type H+-transporting ATPase subunit b
MTFDLTTFILEIINFLVLMWLLQRFLYKPVLRVIDERRSAVAKKVAEAQATSAEAQSLKEQYTSQLQDWEKEKAQLLESLRSELREQRKAGLEKLRLELEEEKMKTEAILQSKHKSEALRFEKESLALAAKFAGAVFSRLASPDLERHICKIFLDDLSKIDNDRLARISSEIQGAGDAISVTTAYPISQSLRTSITGAVNKHVGSPQTFQFNEDPALIAGIKLTAGGTVLQASLADALTFFEGPETNGTF